MDGKSRLAVGIQAYTHCAGRSILKPLDHGRVDAVTSKDADGLAAARIISDRTEHGYIAAEQGRVTREICGCATESGAFWKQIP